MSKLNLALQSAMRESEAQAFDVIVSFRRPPGEVPEAPALSVHGKMGDGRLDRQAIERLAARDDVLSIELMPELELYSTEDAP